MSYLTTEQSTINWNNALQPESVTMTLKETTIGEPHTVTFLSVRQNSDGSIVATVDSESIEGDTLWLSSAMYGAQNGLGSLIKACGGDGSMIEGGDFVFTRVESDKSPAGYAYMWTA